MKIIKLVKLILATPSLTQAQKVSIIEELMRSITIDVSLDDKKQFLK